MKKPRNPWRAFTFLTLLPSYDSISPFANPSCSLVCTHWLHHRMESSVFQSQLCYLGNQGPTAQKQWRHTGVLQGNPSSAESLQTKACRVQEPGPLPLVLWKLSHPSGWGPWTVQISPEKEPQVHQWIPLSFCNWAEFGFNANSSLITL